ncbi:uncharacterized protein BJ212DRAFT_1397295 [Suillus subaureus]|uniref:F-box domain-containing protein n=1 Tax=Suillus subaureus TaxID=48587 RepID=A0A9P7DTA7_9AGAM|nr:uncharacterized protein BJ212DRAFT_1397295 [Suillus subaureus]KAG1802542.1 hypothetical protein BJ212DRAFT_1397295 [Suillus subaureus]
MDLLWAEVDRLQPLLGCVTRLHPLIYRRGRAPWDDTWAEGIEPLSANEAREFLHHSARIRSLNIPSTDRLFPLLSVIPVDACVFPRLQSLTLFSGTHLSLFLSHTLRHCAVFSVNTDLPQSIAVPESTADQLSILSDRVRLFKQLVTLSCPPLDWAAWKHLSNLPTLVEVGICEVRGHGAPPWPLDRHIVNFSPFLNLTALSFTVDSAAYMTTILQHSQFPSLKRFWIMIEVVSSTEAERLFRALSHYKQTLEQLTVILSEYHDLQNNYLTAITHLLCFTQLRFLQFDCLDSSIYLDNNLLLEAMSAWPHIHTLKIEDCGIRPSITFRGLFTALRQCPQLESLRVLIDTVNIDIDPNAEPIQHTSLRTLDLETFESPIGNAEVLARIIFKWLPCVDQVNKVADDWEPWDEVNMHLVSLRAAVRRVVGGALNT